MTTSTPSPGTDPGLPAARLTRRGLLAALPFTALALPVVALPVPQIDNVLDHASAINRLLLASAPAGSVLRGVQWMSHSGNPAPDLWATVWCDHALYHARPAVYDSWRRHGA